jgi:hypothetical protein
VQSDNDLTLACGASNYLFINDGIDRPVYSRGHSIYIGDEANIVRNLYFRRNAATVGYISTDNYQMSYIATAGHRFKCTNTSDYIVLDLADSVAAADSYVQITNGKAGTSNVIIEAAGTANDLSIKCGAAKTLVLTTPVYDDLNFATATGKLPASNYPTFTQLGATSLYGYTFAIDDYLPIESSEVLHGYKEGTDLEIHLHLIQNGLNDATARKAKYTVYYGWADVAEVFTTSSLTAELDIPAATEDLKHLYLSMGTITGTNFKKGSALLLTIKRIAGTGTEPAADPFVVQVGVHYEKDKIGSRSMSDV